MKQRVDLRRKLLTNLEVLLILKFQHHKFLEFYAEGVAAEEDTAKAIMICGGDLFCQILKHRDNQCKTHLLKNLLRNTCSIFPRPGYKSHADIREELRKNMN